MVGNRILDSRELERRKCWILLQYPDGSEFCFLTTLNPDILRDTGIVLEEGMLVRLDKKYYIDGNMVYRQFPYQGVSVSLWESLTYTDEASYSLHDFL